MVRVFRKTSHLVRMAFPVALFAIVPKCEIGRVYKAFEMSGESES